LGSTGAKAVRKYVGEIEPHAITIMEMKIKYQIEQRCPTLEKKFETNVSKEALLSLHFS